MPTVHCPRCSKAFKTEANLLRHTSQPESGCLKRYQERLAAAGAAPLKRSYEVAFNPANDSTEGDVLSTRPLEYPTYEFDSGGDSSSSNGPHSEPQLSFPSESSGPHKPAPYFTKWHPSSAKTFGKGESFMEKFDSDVHAEKRQEPGLSHYPFASKAEWETAWFLERSGMSQETISEFLDLETTKSMNLSFKTANDLRSRIEILPAGPSWKSKDWKPEAPTKQKSLTLFYRDPLECLQSLMQDPIMKDHIHYTPFQLFKDAQHTLRTYTEWLSGNHAWQLQDAYPPGATVLGTILSSDKTTITHMTGNRVAHPVLISLANIDMEFRMKGSNRAFMLLALLPIPTFLHPTERLRGVLADRLFHSCLDFILEPLKIVAKIGTMLTDGLANRRYCFTPLVSYIADTPESQLIAGVTKGCSSITTATVKEFGDDFRHPSRTAAYSIGVLQSLKSKADPSNVEAFWSHASEAKYNGVAKPFWMDWALAEPCVFLTSEPLHHWHKEFWDHDAKWCITAVGASELDFRFSILHQHTGHRHFKEGISSLKQVTGREHREIERSIVAVIAGAVPAKFLRAIRALMDFRYLAQSLEIDEDTCQSIDQALKEFHDNKQAVLDIGARTNKKGQIKPWHITKLEFLHSVAWNIRLNGVALQWSADGTERAHIDVIKVPSENTNNHQYEAQIVRHLDRGEKCRLFSLATSIKAASGDVGGGQGSGSESESEDSPSLSKLATGSKKRNDADYFAKADAERKKGSVAPRTFSVHESAYHLNYKPAYRKLSIEEASTLFNIPDLPAALSTYVQRLSQSPSGFVSHLGGRRSASAAPLPFEHIAVWTKVRIQNRTYHSPHTVIPSQALNIIPPGKSPGFEFGRYDFVVANFDASFSWPHSGLQGHQVVELRLVFLPIFSGKDQSTPPALDKYLTYARRYDIVPQVNKEISGSARSGIYPEPDSSLFLVRRAIRASGEAVGDILPLDQVRTLVDLVPNWGEKANRKLTSSNASHFCSDFWLNKYFSKELYLALSSC